MNFLMETAMNITNNNNLPEVWVNACKQDTYSGSHEEGYSVTQLLNPVKIILLEERHKDKLYQDVSDMVATVMGTAMHQVLEDGTTVQSIFDARKIFDRAFLANYFFGKMSFDEAMENLKFELQKGDLLERLIKENENENIISEKRYNINYNGVNISAGIDITIKSKKTIMDIKNVKVSKYIYKSFDEWTEQLNDYRYIYEHVTGKKIETLQILAIFKDWDKGKYELEKLKKGGAEPNYPSSPVMVIDIDVMDDSFTTNRWDAKLDMIEACKDMDDDEIPECSKEERWQRDSVYRLMGKDRKTAYVRSQYYSDIDKKKRELIKKEVDKRTKKMSELTPMALDAIYEEEKAKLDKNTYILKEDAKPTRCVDWCTVKHFCHFYKKWEEEND